MTAPNCNGHPLLAAAITEPLIGRWVADVQVDTDVELSDPIRLSFAGSVVYTGAIFRGGIESGRWIGRIVGGTNGLSTTLEPKAYRSVPLSVVLADVLTTTGESLSDDSETLLDAIVAKWQRVRGTAAHCVASVADSLGYDWRILRDGSLWLGPETWPDLDEAVTRISHSPGLGVRTYAPESGPTVYPGVVLDGWRVDHVDTRLEGSIRQEVYGAAA